MMAQGASAPAPTNGVAPSLTAAELREILEYERILQFRDAVLAGTHPRVKIPAHLAIKNRNVSTPNVSTPTADPLVHPSNSTPSSNPSSFYNKSPNTPRSIGTRVPISSHSEINPILLEKSDDLIKAEIQLQRQRLERALREQIEQQRIAAKALLQTSESLPNFDLTEVLSKALAIVHPSTTAEVDPSVGARSPASDSFDENTFYSSQHDTPEPSTSSQSHREPLQSGNLGDEYFTELSSKDQGSEQDVVITGTSVSQSNFSTGAGFAQNQISYSQNQASVASIIQGSTDLSNSRNTLKNAPEIRTSEKIDRLQDSTTGESNPVSDESDDPLADAVATQGKAISRQGIDDVVPSPLIRNHNLSPIAPQPARVSPLATARDPPVLREALSTQDVQPAQVTALRNIPGISSTDSSPKNSRKAEKKKEKKRKRKGKDSRESPESPYIKPEPKSPSPFAVAPLPRPQKRQRQSGQYSAELNYDDSRHEPEQHVQRHITTPYDDGHATHIYERNGDSYTRVTQPISTHRRVDSRNEAYRRVSGGHYVRRPESPAVFAIPPAQGELRPLRTASALVERRVYDDGQYYREPVTRASVRPDADRERSRSPIAMGPPRQPMRVVIDEHGRKYYEPVPASIMRQSVAPPSRYREEELIYARNPVRTVASRAIDSFEDEGMVIRRGSPSVIVPRRVVTQPEYAAPSHPDYRSYRQREYSIRPATMAPPGDEYVQIRGPAIGDRRPVSHLEEPPREFSQRAVSVRPEAVRYELPREYVRMPSVRPEAPPREYAASVRPEAHRETIPQGQREYSVRPNDSIPRREPQIPPDDGRYYNEGPVRIPPRQERVIVQEDGRYYEEVPGRRVMEAPTRVAEGERYYAEPPPRRPAEFQYIERPRVRESSVVIYADDPRAVYR